MRHHSGHHKALYNNYNKIEISVSEQKCELDCLSVTEYMNFDGYEASLLNWACCVKINLTVSDDCASMLLCWLETFRNHTSCMKLN